VEVSPSQFAHEKDGLDRVRALLPDTTPFRAWSGFEFRDDHGKWYEVDLLVLGHRRLHLVELKYYSGVLTGDDLTWRRDGHRAEDSPLKLARRKAQRLKSKLQDELMRWAKERGTHIADPRSVVPFVQEAVFLHHPGVRCDLPTRSREDLFALDGATGSGLPGISARLLENPRPRDEPIRGGAEDIIVSLMSRIGAVQRRQRQVGSWVIDDEPLGEGDGWQDWPAFNQAVPTDRVRIRFLVTRPGATAATGQAARRIADHEYRIVSRLANERLLRPRDRVNHELGVGLVYPLDDRFQRLDLWLADQGDSIPAADRLSLLRQVAEAVAYAHDNRVVHRGLTPHAILVRPLPEGGIRVLVGDWQSAGTLGPAPTGLPSSGITGLMGPADGSDVGAGSPGQPMSPGAADVDRQWAEAFQAPEGVWSRGADRIRLDVFALGALAHLMLSGRPAAPDLAALHERLYRDDGLDLAADVPQVLPAVRALVLEATRPTVPKRLPDVRSFLERLSAAEAALAGRAEDVIDPLEASPRSVIDGRFRLERRLGAGSTAVGLLVTDLSPAGSPQDGLRVLKVAVDDAAAVRLADEARVLAGLDHPRLVRLVEGPLEIGGRQALILQNAGEETLAEALHRTMRLPPDLLCRWGGDLLEALVALDRADVHHRDIKPANLGIREDPGDGLNHLVLFDFSLTNADPGALTAGTPPYLDPFLDSPGRGKYDSPAERYSAAVVLFEMATGAAPRFGDGLSHPRSVHDEAAIDVRMFDPAQPAALAAFFRTALARSAGQRHASAADMLSAWRAAFADPAPAAGLSAPDDPAQIRAVAAIRLLSEAEDIAQAIDSGPRNSNFVREGVLAYIASVVARVDPARAEHLARDLAADRAAALAHVAATVADTDPAQAARLLADAQHHVSNNAQHFRWHFSEVLLVRRQVIRAVDSRPTLARVIRAMARKDSATVTRLLAGAEQVAQLDEDLRDELLAGIAAAATVADATRAEQIARGVADPQRRAEALGRVASALAGIDPDRAERIARGLASEPGEPTEADRASASWAARALAEIARAAPPADGRRARLLARAERLARNAESEHALIEVAEAVGAADRARARRLLAEAERLARRAPGHEPLVRVVQAMAGLDLADAEKIARGIAEEATQAEALAQVAMATRHLDAPRAAQLVAEAEQIARTVPDELVRRPETLIQVLEAAALADPDRAEPIARNLIGGSADSTAGDQAEAARALAAIADVWLAPRPAGTDGH
jgi:serine/threonine protein kinase